MVTATRTRHGDWMQVSRGTSFWPLDPRQDEIDIRDVAHALSMVCRYGGHCLRFESVAEHSLYVSYAVGGVSPENALWGLLHDASEAYLGDIPRPLKPHLQGYAEWERHLMSLICLKFGLSWPMPDVVKEMDRRILSNEREQNMAPMAVGELEWGNTLPAIPGVTIHCLPPEEAERRFLNRFNLLTVQGL